MSTNPPATPRTLARLQLENLKKPDQLTDGEEVQKYFKDVTVHFKLPSGESATKTFSTGENIQDIKALLANEFNIPFGKIDLTITESMLDPLSLADYPSIRTSKTNEISINVSLNE